MKNRFYHLFLTVTISIAFSLGLSAQVYVDINATGANNGTSWQDAYTDLSTPLGIIAGGQIWVAQGIYKPGSGSQDSSATFKIASSISVYGGFNGTETSLDQRDFINNQTILSGDLNGDDIIDDFETNRSDNAQHVVFIDSLLFGCTLDGFYIQNGHTSDNENVDGFFRSGGGVISYSLSVIKNCSFSQNFGRSGASIYITSIAGNINGSEVSNCSFRNNRSTAQSAGILVEGADGFDISDSEFVNNQTNRGTVYSLFCNNLTVDNCSFRDNMAIDNDVFGAAFFVWQSINMSILNSEFVSNSGNNAPVIYFDARNITGSSNLLIDQCSFRDNIGGAAAFGGCLYNWQAQGIRIQNSSFTGNQSGNGAAIYSDNREKIGNSDDLFISNCEFLENSALEFGGGALRINQNSVTIENSTGIDNTGANGSHLFFFCNDREVQIRNSSFSGGDANFGGVAALYGQGTTYTVLQDTFSNNQAGTSGGSLIIGFQCDAEIEACVFSSNTTSGSGGAIRIQNDSTHVNISNSAFEANMASTRGGAIYQGGGSTLTIDQSEFFVNNSQGSGGAIDLVTFNSDVEQGSATITNSVFSFNTSVDFGGGITLVDMPTEISNTVINNNNLTGDNSVGGGIYFEVSDSNTAKVNITNATLANNLAPFGAGIGLFKSDIETNMELELQNNLFYNIGNNLDTEGGDPLLITSFGGNLSGDATTSTYLIGTNDVNDASDPLFADPNQLDYHILLGSPAIDIGISSGAPTLDLEGLPRFGPPDAGAFEYDKSVGLKDLIDNSSLAITPNPVLDQLQFSLTESYTGIVGYFIFSADGKPIQNWSAQKATENFKDNINVKSLASGTYILFAKLEDKIVSQQFIKL